MHQPNLLKTWETYIINIMYPYVQQNINIYLWPTNSKVITHTFTWERIEEKKRKTKVWTHSPPIIMCPWTMLREREWKRKKEKNLYMWLNLRKEKCNCTCGPHASLRYAPHYHHEWCGNLLWPRKPMNPSVLPPMALSQLAHHSLTKFEACSVVWNNRILKKGSARRRTKTTPPTSHHRLLNENFHYPIHMHTSMVPYI